jgi:hypothetical protein
VKLLIDRGIDAKVKYMSDYGQERDARSFAIERKQNAIAALLANIP